MFAGSSSHTTINMWRIRVSWSVYCIACMQIQHPSHYHYRRQRSSCGYKIIDPSKEDIVVDYRRESEHTARSVQQALKGQAARGLSRWLMLLIASRRRVAQSIC